MRKQRLECQQKFYETQCQPEDNGMASLKMEKASKGPVNQELYNK